MPSTSTASRQVRNWRGLDVDAFDANLQQSELFQAPPIDSETAFRCYDKTVRHVLGMHHSSPIGRVVRQRMSRHEKNNWSVNIVASDRLTAWRT